ncbi:Aste57867_12950 [Aphanomyces stellatus]|uniref:Aste57867_12950 protein n=1 Tax=Aphanomyces stellatus TaxID=120398 RepID=A0A485KXQ5_9STRA|nr:hypothetical protein As57867_012902 [Aphanomyces stellatus]VFT89796.1 Aste57867_12950 [Aphanomyces stellatus]
MNPASGPPMIPLGAMPPMNPNAPPMIPLGAVPPMIPLGNVVMRPPALVSQRPRAPAEIGPLNVFVGKLPPDLHDNYVRNLLERVGTVVSWKRTADPISGKPKGFGYCTYATALDCIRALKLLNGFSLDSKNILLKVDSTTQTKLDAYMAEMHPQLKFEEDSKNERVAAMLQRLFEERSGLHGGYNNDIASWGDLVENTVAKEKVRGGMIMNEVEKFRLAQEERAAQIEAKRLALIQERLRKDKEVAERKEAAEKEGPSIPTESSASPKKDERRDDRRDDSRRGASPRRDTRRRDRSRSRSRSRDRDRRYRDSRRRSRSRSRDRGRNSYRNRSPERPSDRNAGGTPSSSSYPPPPPPPSAATPAPVEEVKKHSGHVGKIEMKLQKKDKDPKPSSAAAPVASNPVFAVEDDEEVKPSRDFVPLDYTDEEKLAATIEAQVARTVARINSRSDGVEGIIKNIPTDTKGLFRYPVDWRGVEQFNLVDEKMKPWVKKKIVEYLGEEEDTLIGFILRQLSQRAGAQTIADELAPVLEQDAEAFVVSMWRKLIFEVIRAVADNESKR